MADPNKNNILSKKFIVPEGSVVVPHPYDTRVVDKNLSLGRVMKSELDKYLAGLPDDSASATFTKYAELIDGGTNGHGH